jgi:hypothetical protein
MHARFFVLSLHIHSKASDVTSGCKLDTHRVVHIVVVYWHVEANLGQLYRGGKDVGVELDKGCDNKGKELVDIALVLTCIKNIKTVSNCRKKHSLRMKSNINNNGYGSN